MALGGVENLFFVSGSELAFYQEAIAKAHRAERPAPRLVTLTHENVALNAALGNAMIRRAPAATAVHVDAGTLNQGAAIHAAWKGGYPVLMTAGAGPRAHPGSMGGARDTMVQWQQEPRDQNEIVRQFTKMDHRLEHQDRPGLMVSRLLQVAMSEPMGPVYLTIPQETAMLPLGAEENFPTAKELGIARRSWPDPDDAARVANWLIAATSPALYTTRAGADPDAVEELLLLAELLAIPVMESGQASKLNFPATHWASQTGPDASDVDVALVVEDVVPWMPGPGAPGPGTRVVWVTADPVLSQYKTWEFRADLWMPASAVGALRAIRESAQRALTLEDHRRVAVRRAHLEQRRREIDAHEARLLEADLRGRRLTGRTVSYQLGQIMTPRTIVLNDGVSNQAPVRYYAKRNRPGTYFRSGSSAGGWGSGAAFGVKLARPDDDVIHATGDGYLMFGAPLSALWAAGYHRAPYLTVVFINGSYSTGTTGLRTAYPDGVAVREEIYDGGVFEPPPRFDKLAEAANSYGEYVTQLDELAPALRRGLAHTRQQTAALIAVRVEGSVSGR
jgi:acetolactate synthase-1/2/3 large subunit